MREKDILYKLCTELEGYTEVDKMMKDPDFSLKYIQQRYEAGEL